MENTTLRISGKQRDYVKKASQKKGKSMGDYAYQCVYFITKRGYDPYNLDDIQIVEETKKLRSQVVSFIRKQEKDYIIPVHAKVNELVKIVIGLKSVLGGVLEQNVILEGDSIGEGEKSLKPQENDVQREAIERLKAALHEKEEKVKKFAGALQEIKNSSLPGKGSRETVVLMDQERFKELTLLI